MPYNTQDNIAQDNEWQGSKLVKDGKEDDTSQEDIHQPALGHRLCANTLEGKHADRRIHQ